MKYANIKKIAFGAVPGGERMAGSTFVEYKGIEIRHKRLPVDPDYFDLMDIKVLQGRNFNWDMEADFHQDRIIINETAIR